MSDPQAFFDIPDVSKLNMDELVTELPGSPWWKTVFGGNQGKYVSAFLKSETILKDHGINTALRLAHFLGQGLIETGFLRYTSENLNYSKEGLLAVFGRYFEDETDAADYARKPEKIANRVYANRMGNGDEASGDGWKYRGRGFIQLTGKNNYTNFAGLTGLAIDTDPDLITRDLTASIQVAAKFFEVNGLLVFADANDAKKVSRGINFGNPNASSPAHGESDRIWWTAKALSLFNVETEEVLNPRDGGVLKVGSKGEKVEEFQRLLLGLGYPVGGVDGDYGPATRRVVLDFQSQAGLPATGEIDQDTALAIDVATGTVPANNNRGNATEEDVTATGNETPSDSNQVAAAGVVVGIAAAAGAASEILGGASENDPAPEPTPTPTDSATPAETPTPVPTTTSIETPTPTPTHPSGGGPNWILVGGLLLIVVVAVFVVLRARKIKKDQVDAYRDGRVI